jgi:hypothetical protein
MTSTRGFVKNVCEVERGDARGGKRERKDGGGSSLLGGKWENVGGRKGGREGRVCEDNGGHEGCGKREREREGGKEEGDTVVTL